MIFAVDIIKESIQAMPTNPRFYAGNWEEVCNDNKLLAYDKTKDSQRYPLIVLSPIFTEKRGEELGIACEVDVTIYIITETNKNYTVEQRIENVYKPIIVPLYNEMIYTMFRKGKIKFDEVPMSHSNYVKCETENLYYEENKLNDIVDALKININLKIKN